MNTRTYSAKPADIKRKWHLVDAAGVPLGRLASTVASRLSGKHKPIYTPHIDCGDFVVIINAAKFKISGNKLQSKRYYRHSQYPGSLKSVTLEQLMAKDPAKAVRLAVKGMLPDNKLRRKRLLRLKIYPGSEHPHEAQNPAELKVSGGRDG